MALLNSDSAVGEGACMAMGSISVAILLMVWIGNPVSRWEGGAQAVGPAAAEALQEMDFPVPDGAWDVFGGRGVPECEKRLMVLDRETAWPPDSPNSFAWIFESRFDRSC